MSSESYRRPRPTLRLLDSVAGFIIWAGHLLVVYVAAAMYCALASPEMVREGGSTVILALLGITVLALALVGFHAAHHLSASPIDREQRFLSTLALAIDGVAAFAVAGQVIPIMMTPLCR